MFATKLYIVDNPLLPTPSVEPYETENVADFLVAHFRKWPENARIYNGHISESTDVTPHDEETLLRLNALNGPLYVVLYPQAATVAIVVAVVALAVAAAILFQPKIPTTAVRAQNGSTGASPNNTLGERSNTARPLKRIPDIFGTVRCTPDLLSAPYRVFENNREVEYGLFCIGRGSYDVSDIREDRTLISTIPGSSVEIYGPGGFPYNGVKQLTVGKPIVQPLVAAKRYSFASGQILMPSNVSFPANQEMNVTYEGSTGTLILGNSTESFLDYFSPGLSVTLGGFNWVEDPGPPVISANLNGTYTILEVTDRTLVLSVPTPGDWIWCPSPAITLGTLTGSGYRYFGPFDLDAPADEIWINFVADQGLYKDNGTSKTAVSVQLSIEMTPINAAGQTTGSAQSWPITITGSSSDAPSPKAKTAKVYHSAGNSRYRIRVHRITNTDTAYNGQVYDTVKIRDVYGVTNVTPSEQAAFGNVTIAYTAVTAMKEALAIQNRKLNMLVSRRIPHFTYTYLGGMVWTSPQATSLAYDIIFAMAQDDYIGRRQPAQVDFIQIYNEYVKVHNSLTGTHYNFGYTFDDENVSFEEAMIALCSATFTIPYTAGSKLRVIADVARTDSVLLFNHRNKLPNTETRTISFGYVENVDGVELQYVDPNNYDELRTIYAPTWGTPSINAKRIETLGVRNRDQAYKLLQRYWNKLAHQRVVVEFVATQEAQLLVVGDKILVEDNTRSLVYDGEILGQNAAGTVLHLSKDFPYAGGAYNIYLQHTDGTVESIAITGCTNKRYVTLAQAPRLPLAINANNFASATYMIVGASDAHIREFLVVEKSPNSNFTVKIRAVNYDSRFYQDDSALAPS